MLSSTALPDKESTVFANVDLVWSFSVYLQLPNAELPFFQTECHFVKIDGGIITMPGIL